MIYSMVLYCENCSLNKTYGSQFYRIFINYYLTRSLAIFSHFCEVFVSLHRYFILKNIHYLMNIPYKIIVFIVAIVSLLIYLPELFSYNIQLVETYLNETILFNSKYKTIETSFGKSKFCKITLTVISLFRAFISTILLSLINIGNVYQFNKRYKKRIILKLKYKPASSKHLIQ